MNTSRDSTTDLSADHVKGIQRAKLSLLGLSVGDAFGERFFPHVRRLESLVEQRAVPDAPWCWTDDTAMAISMVEVLEASGAINQDHLAQQFGDRYLDDRSRGYGGTAHTILRAIGEGWSWRDVSPKAFNGAGSMGNGGAMRAAPLGAYFADDLDRVVEQARLSAEVTHAHPEGQAGAIAVALAAAFATSCPQNDAASAGADMFRAVIDGTPDSMTRSGITRAAEMLDGGTVDTVIHEVGNGSMVISPDTVPFALWCAARHLGEYEDALWETVSGGGDIDTNAAIVGSIVVLCAGAESVPPSWRESREPLPSGFEHQE